MAKTFQNPIKKTFVLLLLIILLGAFLRVYRLDKFPPSLFGDEVDVGYQAYSILKTGGDYLGQKWPISFHSLADWRTPLYLYATVPFVAAFGLNEWGVRLPAAFFGILTLPLFYLLVRKIFKEEKTALISVFLLSVSMWHLQYSRAAFEVTLMIFLVVAGMYFFLNAFEKWQYGILAMFLFALAPYSYNTAKLFILLLLTVLLAIYRKNIISIGLKKNLIVALTFVLVIVPMAHDVFFGKAADRFNNISIFSDPETPGKIGESRLVDVGKFSGKLFHNKYLVWGQSFIINYLGSFSTEFIFTKGDNSNLRHSVQGGFGQFYWFDALLLIVGIWSLVKLKNKDTILLIIVWLLISPIPSALTKGGANHATRLILLLPPLLIICSLGLGQIVTYLSKFRLKKILLFLLFSIYCLPIILYLHRYYIHYPRESESWWNYGYKQMIQYAEQNKNNYKKVILSDQGQPPLIYWLFWTKTDPRLFQSNKLAWTELSDAIWADCLPSTNYCFGHVSEDRIKSNGYTGTLKPYFLYLMPDMEIEEYFQHQTTDSVGILEKFKYPSGRFAGYALTGI